MQTDPSSLRPKRRIRNYLLDPKFQLRYAALLAGSAGALLMLLGSVVASTSTMAINEARASTDLAALAVEQSARAVAEGEASARVLRLHQLSLGIDHGEVKPDRPTQSISAEDTFEQDIPLSELEPHIRRMAEKAWNAARKTPRIGRTVVLKLKTSDFHILTRSLTPARPPDSLEQFANMALELRDRVKLPADRLYRLVGVGLSNFRDASELAEAPEQPALF